MNLEPKGSGFTCILIYMSTRTAKKDYRAQQAPGDANGCKDGNGWRSQNLKCQRSNMLLNIQTLTPPSASYQDDPKWGAAATSGQRCDEASKLMKAIERTGPVERPSN